MMMSERRPDPGNLKAILNIVYIKEGVENNYFLFDYKS